MKFMDDDNNDDIGQWRCKPARVLIIALMVLR